MNSQYELILDLEVYHSYYEDQRCKNIVFEPQVNTGKMLNRFNLKYLSVNNRFQLFSSSKDFKVLADYIKHISGNNSFGFNVSTNDFNFPLFTQLPINKIGYNSYESTNSNGEYMDSKLMRPDFISDDSSNKILAIKIDFESILNHEIRYCIQLEARKTRWDYYIISQNNQTLNDLFINHKGKNPISFIDKGSRILANGASARLFSSENKKMTMTNYTMYKLDLVNVKTSSSSKNKNVIVFNGLPVPRPENIAIDEQDPDLVVAIMYVYV